MSATLSLHIEQLYVMKTRDKALPCGKKSIVLNGS